MPSFAKGVVEFQRKVFPEKKALFEKLSQGQAPEALMISCSDSRVETGMITQTDPGEIFVCRNPGNIVPPHKEQAGGVTATIEYALDVLHVRHVIVCGHTDCGAMKGALHPEDVENLPHVSEWIAHAGVAARAIDSTGIEMSEEERLKRVTELNVVLQMENLKTHPAVQRYLEKDELQIHGWIYDIATSSVDVYDPTTDRFVPIAEKYAERFAVELGDDHGGCCS